MKFELGKDPDHDGKADNEIIWVDEFKSFLPEDIEKDELATKAKMLIALVKEDHARYSFKKDVKDYAHIITSMVRFAKENGYKSVETKRKTIKETIEEDKQEEDGKWDDIVDA